MKRRNLSTAIITCLIFFIFFFVQEIAISSFSRSSATYSTKAQGNFFNNRSEPKTRRAGILPEPIHSRPTVQPISCDRSHERYDLCSLNSPTVVDPTTSTLFIVDPSGMNGRSTSQTVRPYPRKWENNTMSRIKELTLTSATTTTPCKVRHKAPALVFSAGGYTGNLFHDFNDGFIPLFITTRSISSNQDLVLVIANCRKWWLSKYAELLVRISRYSIVNLDTATATHCFPSATVGLISHGYMTINPQLLPHSETFLDFWALLGSAYVHTHHHFSRPSPARPRLVLVARGGNVGRVIVNQAEVAQIAEEVGFEVVVFEPTGSTSLTEAYGLINASHAMIGVHGAALTHSLFLRPRSVLVQVVPIGIDWLAETCFGKPARDMGLEYMEYKIRVEESSLVEKYGRDDLVLKNPKAVVKNAWSNTMKIYLQNQDVKLDKIRIGRYLRKAYKKAQRFMEKEG